METQAATRRWYQSTPVIILCLVLCVLTFDSLFPLGALGLFLMWRHTRWSRAVKWIVSIVVFLPILLILVLILLSNATGSGSLGGPRNPIGSVCVDGPKAIAAGPADSVYVLDLHHLLRITHDGKLLWERAASGPSSLASDARGNLYIDTPRQIRELSPSGRILAGWRSGGTAPGLVDSHGDVYTVASTSASSSTIIKFSATGRRLAQWTSPVGPPLAMDAQGLIYGIDQAQNLLQLSPRTGQVLHRWTGCVNCFATTYDAVTSDARGTVYVGATINGDTPFAVFRLARHGSRFEFSRINLSEEHVTQLAAGMNGTLYVLRDSYDWPSPTDTGIEELSSTGASLGTFRPCLPNSS